MADFLVSLFAPAERGEIKVVLIDLERHRAKDVVDALKALLAAAEAGNVKGIAYIIEVSPDDHRAGTAGVYRRHPEKALQATFALERHLCDSGPFASSR